MSRDPRLSEFDVTVVKAQKWGAIVGVLAGAVYLTLLILAACGVTW